MDTKNTIKKRMIAQAASAWGISSKEVEKSDPVIPLLLDACAGEIVDISRSITDSRQKIGTRIMEILTPDELTSPYPARAIVSANPVEVHYDIDEDHEFYYAKKIYSGELKQEVDIYFTPTCKTRLIRGEVRYMASHDTIFIKNGPFELVEFCRAKARELLGENQLWIGLNLSKQVHSLDGISFYFEPGPCPEMDETLFYNALSGSSWEAGGHQLTCRCGLGAGDQEDFKLSLIAADREFSKPRAVCYHVNNFYKKKFITLTQNPQEPINLKELLCKYPGIFPKIFTEDKLKELEGNLLWIQVTFAQHVPYDLLQKVNCSVNCFPVINRRSEKVNVTAKERIAGLKAESNEMYLGLKKIRTGNDLKVILNDSTKSSPKTAVLSLRKDNIGRFNSRNALEMIQQMVDAYREEFMSFSKFKNINQDVVENLRNAILPFETLLDELQDVPMDSMPFLVLKSHHEMDDVDVEVEYWLTNGSLANNISSEENLRYDSSNLMRDKIFMITSTSGGSDKKRDEQIAHDFRYALLTRDRIVTRADIKALCYKIFEGALQKVEIKEGVAASTYPNTGLRRTMDIELKLADGFKPDDETVRFLKADLLTHLEEKSSNVLPFRISIGN